MKRILTALLGGFALVATSVAVSAADQLPEPVRIVEPSIPLEYRGLNVAGDVIVRFRVTESGQVRDVTVRHATDDRFAEAVVQAVRQWEFRPKVENGEAYVATVELPVRFGQDPQEIN